MRTIFLKISLLLICGFFSQAAKASESLNVAYGRISLIDLGSLIQGDVLILDDSLVRIYKLSGLNDENKKSVLAIQGLKESGETDLSVRTASGIFQFHIALNPEESEDIIMQPNNSRTRILRAKFPLMTKRMSLITSPFHINEYVLGGDPDLVSVKQVVKDNDNEFLKTFALVTGEETGKTDIVVASKGSVYKFTVEIGANDHAENISLYIR